MNFISPSNHPGSFLSGSTVESMINRTNTLGLGYFAITDSGSLNSVAKAYMYGEKKGVRVIAGVELFFKDNGCEIIRDTPSENIKYFKIPIHAKTQAAYQEIVKMMSDGRRDKVTVDGIEYPLFGWSDLEKIKDVTACTSDTEDLVTKHLLVDRPDIALKYYNKLKKIFGDDYYLAIIPYKQDKCWMAMVDIELESGVNIQIPLEDRVDFEEWEEFKRKSGARWVKSKRGTAKQLSRFIKNKKRLSYIYINSIRHKVAEEHRNIKSIKIINNFKEFDSGDLQTRANRFILSLAERSGSPVLINSNAYYSERNDKVVQDMKLGDGGNIIYQHQYMMSTEDSLEYLKQELALSDSKITNMVENSHEWSNKFSNFSLKYDYRLVEPVGNPQKALLDRIDKVGRMKWDDPVYLKQFREEFDLLTKNGTLDLIPYFLPIVDIYDFYDKHGYLTGPARGSAGGFLISYLVGITHLDPIKYGLYSSRFLTIDRIQQGNLPDIDCDFESRDPLVGKDGNSGYLFEKYGKNAAQVSTRTLLRIKSAILDANRYINGKVEKEIEVLSKKLPNTPQGASDSDFVFGYENNEGEYVPGLIDTNEDLKKYIEERPKEWEIVKRALSLSRQHSRHASAFVISNAPIEHTAPVMEVGGVKRVTQYEAKQIEWAGLIKYDFLVVKALEDINLCIKYINNKNGNSLKTGHFIHDGRDTYIWDLPQDSRVYDMLSNGATETVFQLNTVSVTPFVKKIKPSSIVDCATITSLVRPGPLDYKDEKTGKNMVEEYVDRKYGRSKSDIPILEELLPETYGVLVFQEQVTKIARELAGMNVIDSENVRIAVGKKKKKLIDSLKPVFIEGASKRVDKNTAIKIWNMIETFARYGFNKSHAVAYSITSYACSFLKYHYPLEWWAAVLSNADNKEINEILYKYVKDMVLPPDINVSTEEMSIDYNLGKIRNKLSMISGLGESLANKIIENRPYSSIEDFVNKAPCGPSMSKKLIYIGALDSLFKPGEPLLSKMEKYEAAVCKIEYERRIEDYRQKAILLRNTDIVAAERAVKSMHKFIDGGPKAPKIDPSYINLTPKQDFLMKKNIFPTMNLDLQSVLDVESNNNTTTYGDKRFVTGNNGRRQQVFSSDYLQYIDSNDVSDKVYLCVPGYVIDTREFEYSNGTKKALEIIIDSSGYISSKVLWADYNTGVLTYPEELKKGAIAYFVYYKKPKSPYVNIIDIIME